MSTQLQILLLMVTVYSSLHDDITAGKAAYLVCRVNYLRPAAEVAWSDISSFIDFASQVGGTDS